MRVLGLMSGTSLDGIDAALLHTDGEQIAAFGPSATFAFLPAEKAAIECAIKDALGVDVDQGFAEPDSFQAAADAVTEAHVRAVQLMRDQHDVGDIDLIGFHGQTVLHRPDHKLTIQLGDGAALARRVKVDVVCDLRQNDMALGGQGAPLVPVYHRALLAARDIDGPVAMLNIGGVANMTYMDADTLIAFDTGPGNGLLDQWVVAHGLGAFDEDGALAASGEVDRPCLEQLMAHPYVRAPFPKSLDRYDFSLDGVKGLSAADGAATLAAFTVDCLLEAARLLPKPPKLWVVCGGGRKNRAIMARLSEHAGAQCVDADDLDLRGDDIEAEAFAFLAARSVRGLPITFPGTTGVKAPATGGVLWLNSET